MPYIPMVPFTEGRPRGRATMGRDAVLAGGIRNPAPERTAGSKRCGVRPRIAGHRETRKRTDTAWRAEGRDASIARCAARKRNFGSPEPAIREDLSVSQVTRLFGAPFPSLGGGKKKANTGEPP